MVRTDAALRINWTTCVPSRYADNKDHDDYNMVQRSTDQATLEASVAKIESNPKCVKFYAKAN